MTVATNIGYATKDDIFVRGRNLSAELIPSIDFVDMACLCMLGYLPEPNFKRMINVLLVTSTDHGFTPSSISSRLTFLGAPESLQGAVAAGLLGAGDRYLGVVQNVAEMLRAESRGLDADGRQCDFDERAHDLLERYRSENRKVPGVGHPIHVDGDPRVPSLRQISKEAGYYRACWRLLDAIEAANRSRSSRSLLINGAGAMGAIAADLDLDPRVARGLTLIGRTAGLIAHIVEEHAAPVGPDLWRVVLDAEAK